jgi:propanol-preferring alcohol dehydrogenase
MASSWTPRSRLPGPQIAGTVDALGEGVTSSPSAIVRVPWLGGTCGACTYCTTGRENLCRTARFTGYHRDGGFADACLADARYALPLPGAYSAIEVAPLLCGALIGYRALRLAGEGRRLGLYGFGSAGHMIAQVARHLGREVRRGPAMPVVRRPRARAVGGRFDQRHRRARCRDHLRARRRAGAARVAAVAAAPMRRHHMTDIPRFPYRLL